MKFELFFGNIAFPLSPVLVACLLSCLAITPARYDEGTVATHTITPLQGRGDPITLAHPEGPYMQMHGRIRQELNTSGEFGECIEDAALQNPLPHL